MLGSAMQGCSPTIGPVLAGFSTQALKHQAKNSPQRPSKCAPIMDSAIYLCESPTTSRLFQRTRGSDCDTIVDTITIFHWRRFSGEAPCHDSWFATRQRVWKGGKKEDSGLMPWSLPGVRIRASIPVLFAMVVSRNSTSFYY